MQADFAVELAVDDETLEIPWAAPAGGPSYRDLKRHPELLPQVEEAKREEALAEFLAAMNARGSIFETAKCDSWASTDIAPEEEIYGASWKFASYVDLLFEDARRYSFAAHQSLAAAVTGLLKRTPEIPAAAEFLIRRCYFHEGSQAREGFYVTCYSLGYGENEEQAHQQWVIGLKLAENALRQISKTNLEA